MTLDVSPDYESIISGGAANCLSHIRIAPKEVSEGFLSLDSSRLILSEPGTSKVTYRVDGRIICSAHWDHTVRVYDTKRLTALAVLRHHRDSVYALDFCHSKSCPGYFASGSKDCTIAIWNVYADKLRPGYQTLQRNYRG